MSRQNEQINDLIGFQHDLPASPGISSDQTEPNLTNSTASNSSPPASPQTYSPLLQPSAGDAVDFTQLNESSLPQHNQTCAHQMTAEEHQYFVAPAIGKGDKHPPRYKCAVLSCPYVGDFSRRADAMRHVRTQHGLDMFRCTSVGCNHRCPRRDRMMAHCLARHSDAGLYQRERSESVCEHEACMSPPRRLRVPLGAPSVS